MARTAAPDLTAPAANVIRADRVRVRPSGSENDRILLAKSLQGEKSGSYLGFWLRWTGPEPFFYPNWRYDASRFSRTGSAPSNSPAVSDFLCDRDSSGRTAPGGSVRTVVEFWRGDFPLGHAFWLWGVLGGVLDAVTGLRRRAVTGGAAVPQSDGCTGSEWVGPRHQRGTAVEHYAGIDVSLERSSVCVVDATGRIVREAKVASEPEALVDFFRRLGLPLARVGLEAGPLSQWLYQPWEVLTGGAPRPWPSQVGFER